ncbi:MAG: hypothetical protein J6V32_06515 [Elusimicrobiaceae bacterium]|nr:hypothetical protein [Elusimicrobiaceae bacterium]
MLEIMTAGVVVLVAVWAVWAHTRPVVFARIARANKGLFEKYKETVTTPFTAGRLDFFMFLFHRFRNVFTYEDRSAFIRLADDFIYKDEDPKTKPLPITIFVAEIKKGDFLPVKVLPARSLFAFSKQPVIKTNIPQLDSHYQIFAPSPASGSIFTPLITGFLKTHPYVYLELNGHALVYHEHALIATSQIEAFRFRAMQLLQELASQAVNQGQATSPAASPSGPLQQQPVALGEGAAAALLQIASGRLEAARRKDNFSLKALLSVWVMLVILGGFGFLSWWVLHHWLHY